MSKTNKGSESGFTFLELMVCFGILMMVVVPICSQFMTGINQRHLANSISEATSYGETVLEDIKTQMTSDITTVKSVEGNKKAGNLSTMTGTAKYLSTSPTKEIDKLEQFFNNVTPNQMNALYNTDKYSYEVGLWRAEDITFGVDGFNLTEDVIKKGARLYTDSSYMFDAKQLVGINMPINFKPQDNSYLEINKVGADILDINKVSFEKINQKDLSKTNENDVEITSSASKIKVKCIDVIKTTSGDEMGYTFNIEGESSLSNEEKLKPSVIELDVRKLMRKINSSTENLEYDIESRGITFKFINNTDVNQVIELKQNLAGAETVDGNNDIFNVVIEERGNGKSTVIKKHDQSAYENYIIGIIVREKKPISGKDGRILKKMVDTYSYDVTLD